MHRTVNGQQFYSFSIYRVLLRQYDRLKLFLGANVSPDLFSVSASLRPGISRDSHADKPPAEHCVNLQTLPGQAHSSGNEMSQPYLLQPAYRIIQVENSGAIILIPGYI